MSFFNKKIILFCTILFLYSPLSSQSAFPQGTSQGTTEMNETVRNPIVPNVSIEITEPQTGSEVAFSVRLLLILTILTLAPSILILLTCFLRFSIVLDFIKRALNLQQVPPTAVLNGIAFFMTLFAMWPTFTKIYDNAYKPLADGNISIERAFTEAETPMRDFMFSQMGASTGKKYISVFMGVAKMEQPKNTSDVPTYILIPAYILNELTIAFKIGIILYIPFLIIDMVVASILMSMGMMMLPPVQVSMPFKLILFVLVDGWGLLTQNLFTSVIK